MSTSKKRYLGWDTSSATGIVVAFEMISDQLHVVAEWSLSLEASRHSERLLWTIDTLLQSAGWALTDLDALVVGVGPGSFTGLRIGVTTARILADQLKLPLVPISSLALLVQGAADRLAELSELNPDLSKSIKKSISKTLIIACNDANKGEWYVAFGAKECVMTPEDALAEIKAFLKKNRTTSWGVVGQSLERYASDFEVLPKKNRLHFSDPFLNHPQPRVLAKLGFQAIKKGLYVDASQLVPHYLRDSEAEVKLRKGLLKPQNLGNPTIA